MYVDDGTGAGTRLGKSRVAGFLAVSMCAASRVLAAIPILAISPVVMVNLERTAWMQARPWLRVPCTLACVGAALLTGVPLVRPAALRHVWRRVTEWCRTQIFALFKQTAEVDVRWLEADLLATYDGPRPQTCAWFMRATLPRAATDTCAW